MKIMITKRCSTCSETKPISDFNKQSAAKDGIRSFCRKCQAKKFKIYRQNNKEKIRIRQKSYCANSKAKRKQYRSENKQRILEQAKKYRTQNREKIRELQKKFIPIHREYVRRHRLELKDHYLRELITKGNKTFKQTKIPQSLINLKREEIKIKRLIKELTQ